MKNAVKCRTFYGAKPAATCAWALAPGGRPGLLGGSAQNQCADSWQEEKGSSSCHTQPCGVDSVSSSFASR